MDPGATEPGLPWDPATGPRVCTWGQLCGQVGGSARARLGGYGGVGYDFVSISVLPRSLALNLSRSPSFVVSVGQSLPRARKLAEEGGIKWL